MFHGLKKTGTLPSSRMILSLVDHGKLSGILHLKRVVPGLRPQSGFPGRGHVETRSPVTIRFRVFRAEKPSRGCLNRKVYGWQLQGREVLPDAFPVVVFADLLRGPVVHGSGRGRLADGHGRRAVRAGGERRNGRQGRCCLAGGRR